MRSLLWPGFILWYCIRPDAFALALYRKLYWIGIGEGMYRIMTSNSTLL